MTQGQDRRVGFYAVHTMSNGDIKVAPYGQPLEVGNHLSNARFTSDGRFFLVPDLKWSTKPLRALNFLTTSKLRSGAMSFLDCLMQRSPFQKAGIAELVRVVNRNNVGFTHVNPNYSNERAHPVRSLYFAG